jgi:hypothetical protein
MVFGYTPLDPLVVLWGTLLAIWYLQKAPVKLIGFMPTALSRMRRPRPIEISLAGEFPG